MFRLTVSALAACVRVCTSHANQCGCGLMRSRSGSGAPCSNAPRRAGLTASRPDSSRGGLERPVRPSGCGSASGTWIPTRQHSLDLSWLRSFSLRRALHHDRHEASSEASPVHDRRMGTDDWLARFCRQWGEPSSRGRARPSSAHERVAHPHDPPLSRAHRQRCPPLHRIEGWTRWTSRLDRECRRQDVGSWRVACTPAGQPQDCARSGASLEGGAEVRWTAVAAPAAGRRPRVLLHRSARSAARAKGRDDLSLRRRAGSAVPRRPHRAARRAIRRRRGGRRLGLGRRRRRDRPHPPQRCPPRRLGR